MAPSGKNGSAVERIMAALAELHATGEESPSKEAVGFYSGVDPKSSTMRNACAVLRKDGIILPKSLQLTPKGHDRARTLNIELPKSDDDFHNQFKNRIKASKKTMEVYDLLRFGPPLTKLQIADSIGMDAKKSTFRNTLAPLNKHGLLEQVSGNRLRLANKCFPLGRNVGNKADVYDGEEVV